MKNLIGQTVKDIKVNDWKTIVTFVSGCKLVTLSRDGGGQTQYFVGIDGNIIDL
tara:strand:- start:166 stop:327 length:162 start_codon:yes stop_codon:yes gene_type:complete